MKLLVVAFFLSSQIASGNCGLELKSENYTALGKNVGFIITITNTSGKNLTGVQYSIQFLNVFNEVIATKKYTWNKETFSESIKNGQTGADTRITWVDGATQIKVTPIRYIFDDNTICYHHKSKGPTNIPDKHPKNTTKSNNNTTKTNFPKASVDTFISTANATSTPLKKSRLEFPLFLGQGDPRDGYDTITYGRYITSLQSTLKITSTGIIDQATIDAVKRFINNPKYKQFFSEPVSQYSLDILENQTKPGITSFLYNQIISANAARIRHNVTAQSPQNIIN